MSPDLAYPLAASTLFGLAMFHVAQWVVRTLQSEDLEQGHEWRYDVSRMNELRRSDFLYRFFYPLIQALARLNRVLFRPFLPALGHDIQAAGLSRFWLAEEYLARIEILAFLLAPAWIYVCVTYIGTTGVILALVLTVLTGWLLRHRVATLARHRVMLIKRRMPFMLDLLTLLMEAGSTFLTALEQGVRELTGHPVSEEFGRVLSDISMGKNRAQALTALRERLNDDEISAIVGSIIQSEELGNPLARIFRTQSDVLRIKRTQRAETIAGEAGVNMLLPGILVMASTVLIIFGPFVVNFIYSGFLL
jgi:tight adherence protein C